MSEQQNKQTVSATAVSLQGAYINDQTSNPEYNNFSLSFKCLVGKEEVKAKWTVFYKKSKSLEFATKIIALLKPDQNQGQFEDLFVEGKNINFSNYFHALPVPVELTVNEYNGKLYYDIKNFVFSNKVKSLQQVPFRISKAPPVNNNQFQDPSQASAPASAEQTGPSAGSPLPF